MRTPDPFYDPSWCAITSQEEIENLPKGTQFLTHVTAVTKSGTSYEDQRGPYDMEDLNECLECLLTITEMLNNDEHGLIQVGYAFVRAEEVESVSVVNFYKV